MTDLPTVSTATPTREAALRLAESAITAGLAAGGQESGPGHTDDGESWIGSFELEVVAVDAAVDRPAITLRWVDLVRNATARVGLNAC